MEIFGEKCISFCVSAPIGLKQIFLFMKKNLQKLNKIFTFSLQKLNKNG